MSLAEEVWRLFKPIDFVPAASEAAKSNRTSLDVYLTKSQQPIILELDYTNDKYNTKSEQKDNFKADELNNENKLLKTNENDRINENLTTNLKPSLQDFVNNYQSCKKNVGFGGNLDPTNVNRSLFGDFFDGNEASEGTLLGENGIKGLISNDDEKINGKMSKNCGANGESNDGFNGSKDRRKRRKRSFLSEFDRSLPYRINSSFLRFPLQCCYWQMRLKHDLARERKLANNAISQKDEDTVNESLEVEPENMRNEDANQVHTLKNEGIPAVNDPIGENFEKKQNAGGKEGENNKKSSRSSKSWEEYLKTERAQKGRLKERMFLGMKYDYDDDEQAHVKINSKEHFVAYEGNKRENETKYQYDHWDAALDQGKTKKTKLTKVSSANGNVSSNFYKDRSKTSKPNYTGNDPSKFNVSSNVDRNPFQRAANRKRTSTFKRK